MKFPLAANLPAIWYPAVPQALHTIYLSTITLALSRILSKWVGDDGIGGSRTPTKEIFCSLNLPTQSHEMGWLMVNYIN